MTIGKIEQLSNTPSPARPIEIPPVRTRIIGLTGNMGTGKDAAAALLSMVGYRRIAFADQVRHEVERAIAAGAAPASIHPDLASLFRFRALTPAQVWAKPTSGVMREILQWWGTEYRRSQDPDYWVRTVEAGLERGSFAVSDVRFPNEVEMIRRAGGLIWKINRPGARRNGIEGHASEDLSHIVPDCEIDNSGSIAELAERVKETLRAHKGETLKCLQQSRLQ